MNLSNSGLNNIVDNWVNEVAEKDYLQSREKIESSGGRYSSAALYSSERYSSSRMYGSKKYSDPISSAQSESPDGNKMNLDSTEYYKYGLILSSKIENTTQAMGLYNSDAHKLLVTAMEPLVNHNNFSGEKNKEEVKSKVKSAMLDNIGNYIENNNINPKKFANDTTEILSVLESHNHFGFDVAKEIVNTANIQVSPDLYVENMTKPKQKEESVTNDSEFSPGQYLPRVNMPRDVEDDNEFSI